MDIEKEKFVNPVNIKRKRPELSENSDISD